MRNGSPDRQVAGPGECPQRGPKLVEPNPGVVVCHEPAETEIVEPKLEVRMRWQNAQETAVAAMLQAVAPTLALLRCAGVLPPPPTSGTEQPAVERPPAGAETVEPKLVERMRRQFAQEAAASAVLRVAVAPKPAPPRSADVLPPPTTSGTEQPAVERPPAGQALLDEAAVATLAGKARDLAGRQCPAPPAAGRLLQKARRKTLPVPPLHAHFVLHLVHGAQRNELEQLATKLASRRGARQSRGRSRPCWGR